MYKFSDLPNDAQEYINSRFNEYGISGRDAYNHPDIFPDDLKIMEPSAMVEVLKNKDISHIMPVSKYPELSDKLENIILEDGRINKARQAEIMTNPEKETAMDDLLADIKDGDFDEDGISDLESALQSADEIEVLEIIGASLPIGMVLSGVQVMNSVKRKEIQLNEAPNWFVYKAGSKSIKLAVVGTMLVSGSPIIVSGTVGYLLYKSKGLLKRIFGGLYRGVTSDITKNILAGTGSLIMATGTYGAKAIEATINVGTHDTTKKVAKKTTNMIWNGAKWVSKKSWEGTKDVYNLATHDTTKKVAKKTTSMIWESTKWLSKKSSGFLKKGLQKLKRK